MHRTLACVDFQLRMRLRDPAYVFSTLFLPAGIYWFFAVPESVDPYIASYLVCSFSAFAYLGVVFFQQTIQLAADRTHPWERFLRTLPTGRLQRLFANLFVALLFAVGSSLVIYGLAVKLTPVDLSPSDLFRVQLRLSIASFSFFLLAEFVARIFSRRAVVPVANFLYLSLSFSGGLWKPEELLPGVLQKLAPYLPTYHYGKIVWAIVDEAKLPLESVFYLVAFTAVFFGACLFTSALQPFKRLG